MTPKNQIVPDELEQDVKLLIADDSKDTLDLLMFKTTSIGWDATPVTSASGIIQAMNDCADRGNCYDAIIADINFFDNQAGPRISGITAIREIRKVMPDIPVIFITAFINSITKEEVRRVSAELVPKPFDIDRLYEKVNDMVKWHRAAVRSKAYDGTERRLLTINRSGEYRRVDDRRIQPSQRILQVITQIRENRTT
jgi:DNA-binding response OmpR family regulator